MVSKTDEISANASIARNISRVNCPKLAKMAKIALIIALSISSYKSIFVSFSALEHSAD